MPDEIDYKRKYEEEKLRSLQLDIALAAKQQAINSMYESALKLESTFEKFVEHQKQTEAVRAMFISTIIAELQQENSELASRLASKLQKHLGMN